MILRLWNTTWRSCQIWLPPYGCEFASWLKETVCLGWDWQKITESCRWLSYLNRVLGKYLYFFAIRTVHLSKVSFVLDDRARTDISHSLSVVAGQPASCFSWHPQKWHSIIRGMRDYRYRSDLRWDNITVDLIGYETYLSSEGNFKAFHIMCNIFLFLSSYEWMNESIREIRFMNRLARLRIVYATHWCESFASSLNLLWSLRPSWLNNVTFIRNVTLPKQFSTLLHCQHYHILRGMLRRNVVVKRWLYDTVWRV